MSTITRELAKLFRKITNSEIDAEGNAHVVLSPADSLLINNARIALASLEAEKEYKHHSIIAEQLDHVLSSMDATDHQRAVISCAVDRLNNVSQLLQASPSALLVPETLDYQGAKELFNYLMNEEETNATVNGWNACRAAMLQGAEPASNRDELPLDYLQGHKDGLEWAAQLAEANHPQTGDWLYDDPIELARAIRKGPDMPTAQDGNSPVTPDGWIPVSERMPNDKDFVWCWGYVSGWTESDGFEAYYDATRNKWWTIDDETVRKVTHWMPLPAAPQQEA
ncbi:DUF551 domain-containing protein [Enterobacter asburiae]|uniref:DUF551 domain-containing protein n=1 Tax=Enterobacter asburiae TaxID=61645 RepID=UPI003F7382A2